MFDKTPQMKALVKQAIDLKTQQVADAGTAQFQALEAVLDKTLDALTPDHARLEEHVFVNVFLPFFAKDDPLPYPVGLEHWFGATKSDGFVPVDLIGKSGEIVLTLPPFFTRATSRNLIAGEDGKPSIPSIIAHIKNYDKYGKPYQEKLLDQFMTDKRKAMVVPGSMVAASKEWNAILVHYGRPPLVDPKKLGMTGASAVIDHQDPDLLDDYTPL